MTEFAAAQANLPLQGPMSHTQLSLGMRATSAFFNAQGNQVSQAILAEVDGISESAQRLPGFQGCFGLGYPFYAINASGAVEEVPAIAEHLADTQSLIAQSRTQTGEAWPCAQCQETNDLPDLKTLCKPCDRTVFKPRDLFRGLPDIDVVTVIDEPTEEVERGFEALLSEQGLIQSDNDIRGAFIRAVGSLNSREWKLPVDAHIWSFKDFTARCAAICEDPAQIDNVIRGRSLHARWEDHDINFWFDFVFSLTNVGNISDELKEVVINTRRAVAQELGEDRTVELVQKVSVRGRAIIAAPKLRTILKDRIKSWSEL